jgi:hypothetical protein
MSDQYIPRSVVPQIPSRSRLDEMLAAQLRPQGAAECDAVARSIGSDSFLVEQPAVLVSRIEVDGHRLFQFAPHGRKLIVLPVFYPHTSFLEPVDDAALIDFIAFDPRQPHRWWQRTGAAAFLRAELLYSIMTPVMLFEHPLAWLRGGGRGLVALGDEWEPLRALPCIRFEKGAEYFARRVRSRLLRPFPIPRMEIAA